ncbi:MAG: hypothetical protein K1X83_05825 [Oligoflexia bacterium]|nr:hypothetical protein [Oligoflexia bacterium]
MAKVSLDSVIDKSLINRFRGLASGSGSSNAAKSVTAALSGKSGAVTIADGLRTGARTFASAVQNINSSIGLVNVSRAVLTNLGELTDKMLALAERASQNGTGAGMRANLDREFKKLSHKFVKAVEDTKLGDRQLLTVEGLTQVFQTLGLDPDTSASIAEVFSQFTTPADDDSLASSKIKGYRPVKVPSNKFATPVSDTGYNIEKITDNAISGSAAKITRAGNVFIDTDDILNANPGYDSIFIKNSNGTLQTMEAGLLNQPLEVLTINSTTGSSLIGTNQDLGGNSGGDYCLYLIDSSGAVKHRFNIPAGIGGATLEGISDFQLSEDDTTISYIQQQRKLGIRTTSVVKQTASSFSSTGGSTVGTTVASISYQYSLGDPVRSFDTLKMSDDGTSFAYNLFDGDTGEYYTYFDPWTQAQGVVLNSFDFLENNKLVYIDSGDGQVHSHTYADGSSTALTAGLSGISQLTALEAGSGNSGYFAVNSSLGGGARRLQMYGADSATALYTLDSATTDVPLDLSLAYNTSDQAEMGIFGVMRSLSGDADAELYRIKKNAQATTGQRFERMSNEFSSLFASDANIRSRADAFRMKVDLKALRGQIDDNIKAIDHALEVLGQNLELARQSGLAFLSVSDTISSSADAAQVAKDLRTAIRKNAGAAISQAENLEPMIVAALVLDTSA